MNPTSRAILQTVLTTDSTLSGLEKSALQQVMEGRIEAAGVAPAPDGSPLLVPQKAVAELLSVSRVTVWRLTKDGVLHPVEILPGTWRYRFDEVAKLARCGQVPPATETRAAKRPPLADGAVKRNRP